MAEDKCCDRFDPKPWDEKTIEWNDKLFVKDHVTSLFHIPLNMGSKITKNMALIKKADSKESYQLMLSDEKSMWGCVIYIAVVKDVPGGQIA